MTGVGNTEDNPPAPAVAQAPTNAAATPASNLSPAAAPFTISTNLDTTHGGVAGDTTALDFVEFVTDDSMPPRVFSNQENAIRKSVAEDMQAVQRKLKASRGFRNLGKTLESIREELNNLDTEVSRSLATIETASVKKYHTDLWRDEVFKIRHQVDIFEEELEDKLVESQIDLEKINAQDILINSKQRQIERDIALFQRELTGELAISRIQAILKQCDVIRADIDSKLIKLYKDKAALNPCQTKDIMDNYATNAEKYTASLGEIQLTLQTTQSSTPNASFTDNDIIGTID